MEYETHLVELSEEELLAIQEEIHAWKEEYGDVYITEFEDGSSFVWRTLSKREFERALEYYEDDFDRAEYVCSLCVLDPVEIDYAHDMIAGIPEVLTENILLKSGFGEDATEMEHWMKHYENEMSLFSNQISCIVVEAFPYLTIDEVENWNLKKTLWYYSRAMWTLNVLRGVNLSRDEGDGIAAPDGTTVKGDPRDFPELM